MEGGQVVPHPRTSSALTVREREPQCLSRNQTVQLVEMAHTKPSSGARVALQLPSQVDETFTSPIPQNPLENLRIHQHTQPMQTQTKPAVQTSASSNDQQPLPPLQSSSLDVGPASPSQTQGLSSQRDDELKCDWESVDGFVHVAVSSGSASNAENIPSGSMRQQPPTELTSSVQQSLDATEAVGDTEKPNPKPKTLPAQSKLSMAEAAFVSTPPDSLGNAPHKLVPSKDPLTPTLPPKRMEAWPTPQPTTEGVLLQLHPVTRRPCAIVSPEAQLEVGLPGKDQLFYCVFTYYVYVLSVWERTEDMEMAKPIGEQLIKIHKQCQQWIKEFGILAEKMPMSRMADVYIFSRWCETVGWVKQVVKIKSGGNVLVFKLLWCYSDRGFLILSGIGPDANLIRRRFSVPELFNVKILGRQKTPEELFTKTSANGIEYKGGDWTGDASDNSDDSDDIFMKSAAVSRPPPREHALKPLGWYMIDGDFGFSEYGEKIHQGRPVIMLSVKSQALLGILTEFGNVYCAFELYRVIIQEHMDSTKGSERRQELVSLAIQTKQQWHKWSVGLKKLLGEKIPPKNDKKHCYLHLCQIADCLREQVVIRWSGNSIQGTVAWAWYDHASEMVQLLVLGDSGEALKKWFELGEFTIERVGPEMTQEQLFPL